MDSAEINELSDEVSKNLRKRRSIAPDKHEKHHAWIEQKLEDEEDLRKYRKKVIRSGLFWAMGLAAVFTLKAVGKALYLAFKSMGGV